MSSSLKALVQEYGWLHTCLGLLGKVASFVGNVAFLPSFLNWKAIGVERQTVWVFIFGALIMPVGNADNLFVRVCEARAKGA